MNRSQSTRPDWLSDDMYPFESRFFTTPSGHRMHFVDEGTGEPIVFVHGNPAWSFEFRHLIGGLRSEFRCVAPDQIGFGLSSRSADAATNSFAIPRATDESFDDANRGYRSWSPFRPTGCSSGARRMPQLAGGAGASGSIRAMIRALRRPTMVGV